MIPNPLEEVRVNAATSLVCFTQLKRSVRQLCDAASEDLRRDATDAKPNQRQSGLTDSKRASGSLCQDFASCARIFDSSANKCQGTANRFRNHHAKRTNCGEKLERDREVCSLRLQTGGAHHGCHVGLRMTGLEYIPSA